MGLSDLGDALSWGEAKILLEDAAVDGGTPLGAELSGWAYQASMIELLSLMAQIGDPKVAKRVMPWALELPGRKAGAPAASAAEVAAANAELDADFVFE
ncbi:hypothetical protein [Herbiconiux sp.]|uniref:hypothetical protein n=1 Tax=Herbiconiux sp. TaxID=1871186 RepID=UPI0025BD0458|nr:hypothetical protein [Herbiconiux sp.]